MEFSINNLNVYGMDESIVASGYPMNIDISDTYDNVSDYFHRAEVLAQNHPGTGHNNFLKGISVHFDVTAPQYWWMQAERYHWFDIVSSQSKMHRMLKMDVKKQCNIHVDDIVINLVKEYIYKYHNEVDIDVRKEIFYKMISNCPMGFMLTARIATNYLQLKTIYHQRRNHKLEDWQVFCDWVETLPNSSFITKN
jgi:hypothetical protein